MRLKVTFPLVFPTDISIFLKSILKYFLARDMNLQSLKISHSPVSMPAKKE